MKKELKEKLSNQLKKEIKNVMYGNLHSLPLVIQTFINTVKITTNITVEELHEILNTAKGLDRTSDKFINKFCGVKNEA